jgi:hypothetical protein
VNLSLNFCIKILFYDVVRRSVHAALKTRAKKVYSIREVVKIFIVSN